VLSGEAPAIGALQSAGGRIFYEMRPPGAEGFALHVAERLGAPPRVLLDPATLGVGAAHVSLDWWSVAPDGRHVAYGLSTAGSEDSVLHVLAVESGETLAERIDRTPFAGPSWLPDGSGFFYNRLKAGPRGAVDSRQDSACWLHRLGQDARADRRVLARGMFDAVPMTPVELPWVITDPSSRWVLALAREGVRHANPLHAAPLAEVLAGTPTWRRIADVADSVTDFALVGDTVYLLSTRDAMNGRVLATSVLTGDAASAREIVAESDIVVERLHVARDALYVRGIEGGYGRLSRRSHDGGPVATVDLPYEGSVVGVYAATVEHEVHVALTGWLEPRSIWRLEPGGGLQDSGFPPPPAIDTSPYAVVRSTARARDGTRVPVSVIARRDVRRPASTLVSAYGAYQSVSGPVFNPRAFAFLDAGGVLATAHVRGGGEYGRAWWEAGKGPTKPNSWRDLIDACEHLIAEGWTTPERLAIRGVSAGGITAGRALTERPDLFAAAVLAVGVLNTLRAEYAPNGPPNVPEYGTVTEEAGFRALKVMDALHAVADGVPYPAVLLTHGLTDSRVEPWMSAKMAARLQAATASEAPVLLRVTADAGHGIGSTRTQLDEELSDVYAFVLWRTGGLGA
jgi:prolyl oligopeptidase